LVVGFGFVFSVNTNASEEWRKTYSADWEASSLKSAMKINKKEKVKYSRYEKGATFYWDNIHLKINDLRGDGNVYYVFDVDRYYRVSEDYKVVSSGKLKYKKVEAGDHLKDWGIFELTEDNLKFLFKISVSSQIADIKSKFYDYKGYRRYQLVLADTKEQKQIISSIKNYEDNKYVKIKQIKMISVMLLLNRH
tara:strand:- start:149 stop:727 length:579 start_codon:yes stop_codon:yes gene_type:complete